MNPRNLFRRIVASIVADDPHPEPSRLDRMDAVGDHMMSQADPLGEHFDSIPSKDERPLNAANAPGYAAAIDSAGGCINLADVTADQEPLLADLSVLTTPGHQVHHRPDVACDCCAGLDYWLAGVMDDGETGR